MAASKTVHVFIGTHKGAFIFTSDIDRKKWNLRGAILKGSDVNHLVLDTRQEPILYACRNDYWWGQGVQYSRDLGETWEEPDQQIRFAEDHNRTVEKVWHIAPGNAEEPDVLYAGVAPAALFKSTDKGNTWQEVSALARHESREKWAPGAGGLMVHSICPDHWNTNKMQVGISAAGCFATDDGGMTWEPRNKNVLADFLPDTYPDVGQCVHHMESHPAVSGLLYQQNHCGVYRSDNAGLDWIDISEGLPSRFGFPLVIHPKDPDTVYVIPEESPEFRCSSNNRLAVYRSGDKGMHWEALTAGLPDCAYLNVLRQSFASDGLDDCGLYIGTSTGQIFYSRNSGDHWELLADFLPPIFCVGCGVV